MSTTGPDSARLLKTNSLPALLEWRDQALAYFVRRDLAGEAVAGADILWTLPESVRVVKKQLPDGSWAYPGKSGPSAAGQNCFLAETYRNLRVLVEMYGFTRAYRALRKATEYVFPCQIDEGDIWGILGNQYMPYWVG